MGHSLLKTARKLGFFHLTVSRFYLECINGQKKILAIEQTEIYLSIYLSCHPHGTRVFQHGIGSFYRSRLATA